MTKEKEFADAIRDENTTKMKELVENGFNINKTYPYPLGCKVR